MRAPLRKVRHDCADLFRLMLLGPSGAAADEIRWDMTPCVVRLLEHQEDSQTATEHWFTARHPYELLDLPNETEVLCPWPGQKRCDVFRFTVGEFRAAWEAWGAEQKGGAQ